MRVRPIRIKTIVSAWKDLK